MEELINYFPYDYAAPASADTPFKANVSIMPTPWNDATKLMRIGIKGYVPPASETARANLVFLIDTSGSMQAPDKLPLLRNAFRLLLTSLHPDDTVAIVTYAGAAGTALEPTKVSEQAKILAALDQLSAGGSTAGAEGIRQAYALAEAHKVDGTNRVILATDGDFNVGIADTETLKDFVARKRETGVSLSVLGFGVGNYNDALMQALAQNGNGNAAYIDTLTEARKVLVDDVAATLQTIAKDVKIQVEFNPAAVAEYRLIGYETRVLEREDFNNDKVDAGEIGAGHTVTALYEITPTGSEGRLIDDLRYESSGKPPAEPADEIAFVKIRYKQPGSDKSTLITIPVTRADEVASIEAADADARFAAAVAGFGQVLKGGRYTGAWSIDDAIALAEGARGPDRFGYRNEFLNLARLAKSAQAMAPLRQ
ncbi:vWA domain-containing protein [Methyloceanibacter marginalis]|uniref:vWA domain-containing protein n=1 Tax=Methyloceanibacter marginalis TaxID=1774971 RepID=UPI000A7A9A4E